MFCSEVSVLCAAGVTGTAPLLSLPTVLLLVLSVLSMTFSLLVLVTDC